MHAGVPKGVVEVVEIPEALITEVFQVAKGVKHSWKIKMSIPSELEHTLVHPEGAFEVVEFAEALEADP